NVPSLMSLGVALLSSAACKPCMLAILSVTLSTTAFALSTSASVDPVRSMPNGTPVINALAGNELNTFPASSFNSISSVVVLKNIVVPSLLRKPTSNVLITLLLMSNKLIFALGWSAVSLTAFDSTLVRSSFSFVFSTSFSSLTSVIISCFQLIIYLIKLLYNLSISSSCNSSIVFRSTVVSHNTSPQQSFRTIVSFSLS